MGTAQGEGVLCSVTLPLVIGAPGNVFHRLPHLPLPRQCGGKIGGEGGDGIVLHSHYLNRLDYPSCSIFSPKFSQRAFDTLKRIDRLGRYIVQLYPWWMIFRSL
jgi:hypothetical protein